MRYVVCAVFDVGASAYMRPIFLASLGQMVRTFGDEVNRRAEDNIMYNHPGDFQLFHLGYFDDGNGRFDLLDQPVRVALGLDMKIATGGNGHG